MLLEFRGLITKEFRRVGDLYNVLFIEPVPEEIKKYSDPTIGLGEFTDMGGVGEFTDTYKLNNRYLRVNSPTPLREFTHTNTKTTTETTTETTHKRGFVSNDTSSSVDQSKKKRKPARKSKAGTKKIVGKEKSLHSKAKERFNFWYEKFAPNSPPLYSDAKEIGQLTQMLNRLQDAARKKNVEWETDEDFIAKVFDVFCQKFIESKKWYSDCFSPSSIVSKWNIIIQTLQNEKSKSSSKSGQGVTDSYKAKILAALA